MFKMTNKNRRIIAGVIGGMLALVMVLGVVGSAVMSMM